MPCPRCQSDTDEGATHCFTCGHALTSPTTVIRKGAMVAGRYQILEALGKGGMGTVYKAYDRTLDEHVALKVLRPEIAREADMARRFRQEIKLARRVRHRNVCGIHEYGEEGDLRFIAMEFIAGVDLRRVLHDQGGLPTQDAFEVAIQVADGLHAIHEAGIIHRDLKTPNIMRDAKGVVRLMDFGIAKQHGSDATLGGTAMGMIVGTPEYMSPEQARGEKVDFRSDVYALGIVVYELFTGNVPFRGDTPMAVIFKHIQEPPPLEGAEAAVIPAPVLRVLSRALAKAPDERFPTVGAMTDALRTARSEWAASGPPLPVEGTGALQPLPQPAPGARAPTQVPTDVRTAVRTLADRRERALQEAVAHVEAFLAAGALDEAAEALARGRATLGDAEAFNAVAQRLDQARQRARQATLQQRMAHAASLLKAGRAADAQAVLTELLAGEPGHAPARALLEQANARLARQAEEERRRQELSTAAISVESLLARGDLAGAAQSLSRALDTWGKTGPLTTLAARLEEARRRAEAQRRAEETAARQAALAAQLARAESLISASDFSQARQALDEARALDPKDARLKILDQRVEAGQRALAFGQAEAAIRALLDQGALEAAEAEIKRAVHALGQDARFKRLRGELQDVRKRAVRERETAQREAARREAAEREAAAQREAAQHEAAKREAAEREAARREAAQREAAQREAAQREAAQREAAQREAAQREAAQREAAQREAAQREAAKREAAQREAAQREAAQRVARREAAQREAAQREAAQRDAAAQKEAARREAARREASIAAPAAAVEPMVVEARPGTGRWKPAAAAMVVLALVGGWLLIERPWVDDPVVSPAPEASPASEAKQETATPDAAAPTPDATAVAAPLATLVIDALPWGEIVEIADAGGRPVTLAGNRFTPLVVSLPAGDYTIAVRGPSADQAARLSVTLQGSAVARRVADFKRVDADEYFRSVGF